MTIDICITTFHRPKMLGRLLRSLMDMSQVTDHNLRIVVVDNDPDGSARPAVEGFSASSPVPVVYEIEPRKGVSHARNRALELAEGEYVCFVDDDQVVSQGWLRHLENTARRFKADVVFGPVLSDLPARCPDWIRKSGLFNRLRFPTGTRRPFGGAGNVLMTADALRLAGRGFDPAYGLSGGEDTEFFSHLNDLECRMVWCDEAEAWETVTAERASFRWLIRRNFTAGKIYYRVHLPKLSLGRTVLSLLTSTCAALMLGLAAPFALAAGRHVAARTLIISARNAGRLAAVPNLLLRVGMN